MNQLEKLDAAQEAELDQMLAGIFRTTLTAIAGGREPMDYCQNLVLHMEARNALLDRQETDAGGGVEGCRHVVGQRPHGQKRRQRRQRRWR